MKKQNSIANARRLLRQSELGVLSTHSEANDGYPFGSVSTYLSTVNGDVVFYISDLAQHTKNINHNTKMCFTVFANASSNKAEHFDDPNDGARLSILGCASQVSKTEVEKIKDRFFVLYPDSRHYHATHNFNFYKLSCERVRFIGGFGDINWIDKGEWLLDTPKWLTSEQSMIDHMNEDHTDAMQLMCEHHFGAKLKSVEMISINPDGCFIKGELTKPMFITFRQVAYTSQEVRQELVALTQAARTELVDLPKPKTQAITN